VKDFTRNVEAVFERIIDGDGRASAAARRAAFEKPEGPLLGKVAAHAYRVTDEDVAAAKATASEDELFELVVCTAVGQATRQIDSAMAALEEATKEA
jgi:hypothetical protein